MKYSYVYKTSDGVRHEASLHAESREAVFAELRTQGIKPIKVVAADGSKANGEVRGLRKRIAFAVAAVTLIVGVLAGVFGARFAQHEEPSAESHYSEAERVSFGNLQNEVDALRRKLDGEYSKLGMEQMLDGARVAASTNGTTVYKSIERGSSLIEKSRKEAKTVFAKAAAAFPADGEAIKDVQKLYGEVMSEFDAAEISHSNRKYAFALLDGNRGKWEVKEGKIVFLDQRTARMYEYCLEGINTSKDTARWQKDFYPQGQ